ncbi:alpha/beta hydrolase, partial [Curtobacterium flaccumfaciens]|nr:alpha/beta hydrolase [Curtobacterium flaccumfaciens]
VVGVPVVALVPEHDDFLQPEAAVARFALAPNVRVVPVAGAKHLWVGERYVRVVLDAIADLVVPGSAPLPTHWPV